MDSDKFKSQNGVVLVDPNKININSGFENTGVPNYEEMFISVSLSAHRRNRSVITINEMGDTILESDDEINIGMMGTNPNKNNPYYNTLTTNYYEGSNDDDLVYESFGMQNINIKINSSYIPQVNIQFVDVRGLSFFNQEDSPYRILFDFPPPIFELIVKGYYGKSLTYRMHLVKYTTEFKSENSNFIIDAQFVAMTFAPLTDVLFKYVINFPLFDDKTLSPNIGDRPRNTNELIQKLKNLYSVGLKSVKNDNNVKNLNELNTTIRDIDSQIINLASYQDNIYLNNFNTLLFIQYNNKYKQILNFSDYDNYINSTETNNILTVSNSRLFIGVYVGINPNISPTSFNPNTDYNVKFRNIQSKLNEYIKYLNEWADKKLNANPDNDINSPQTLRMVSKLNNDDFVDGNDGYNEYLGIDITNYYTKLTKEKTSATKIRNNLLEIVNSKINSTVQEYLGMTPTIYNIFKILLDDVDIFFKTLRTYSDAAEVHHKKYASIILNESYVDVENADNEIYSFPLFIKEKNSNDTDSGIIGKQFKTKERVAPLEINEKLGENEFPELILVNKFIDTFRTQTILNKQYSALVDKDSSGNNIWFPISPRDTSLSNENIITPYINVTTGGIVDGASNSNNIRTLYETLLKRFYILSQYVLPLDYTAPKTVYRGRIDLNEKFFNVYATGEATNVMISISDIQNLRDNFKTISKRNKENLSIFYNELNNLLPDLYNNNQNQINGYHCDKSFSGYTGLKIINGPVSIMDDIPEYLNEVKIAFEKMNIGREFTFVRENSIYFTDENEDINKTKYVTESLTIFDGNIDEAADNLLVSGNTLLGELRQAELISETTTTRIGILPFQIESLFSYKYDNVIDIWAEIIAGVSLNDLKNYGDDFNFLLIVSHFGSVLTPFSEYPAKKEINFMFNIPSIIELPLNVLFYLGLLLKIDENDAIFDEMSDFVKKVRKLYFFADFHDVRANLSDYDKSQIITYFDSMYNVYGGRVLNLFDNFITTLENAYVGIGDDYNDKRKIIVDVLNNDDELFKILLMKKYILNYSQISFKNVTDINEPEFKSLNSLRENRFNDIFFRTFFSQLEKEIINEEKKKFEEETNFRRLSGDENVITQTYYSFKNINDKWVSSPTTALDESSGYPFNDSGESLIDSFAFVDRAMNPIGDTIINPEILIDLADDYNVNIFSVISQLLSDNGFEFFPLQNFMSFEESDWVDSFKIDDSGKINPNTHAFVCMYIGGMSAYPTNVNKYNNFINDGIVNLLEEDSNFNPDSSADGTNEKFPYGQVRAFRVKFGEQNQSMFKDFNIDSKEYPETNESIEILSRLAGDEGQGASIPKGQNLFSLYEKRAYRATISGLGNVMLQPTQYFQIENIPLFNGAYVILDVEHVIEQNKMATKFSGVKILKYPMPRVTNPSALFGFEGGDTALTNAGVNERENSRPTKNGRSETNENKAKYNSMYTFKIE